MVLDEGGSDPKTVDCEIRHLELYPEYASSRTFGVDDLQDRSVHHSSTCNISHNMQYIFAKEYRAALHEGSERWPNFKLSASALGKLDSGNSAAFPGKTHTRVWGYRNQPISAKSNQELGPVFCSMFAFIRFWSRNPIETSTRNVQRWIIIKLLRHR